MSVTTVTISLDLDGYLEKVANDWGPMSAKPESFEDLVCKRLLEEIEGKYERALNDAIKKEAERIIGEDLRPAIHRVIDRVLGKPIRNATASGHHWDESPLEQQIHKAVQWECNRVVNDYAIQAAQKIARDQKQATA